MFCYKLCYKNQIIFEAKIFRNKSSGRGNNARCSTANNVISLKHHSLTAEQVGRKLRTECKPAIVGRIQKDEFIIDLRTVTESEEHLLLQALLQL